MDWAGTGAALVGGTVGATVTVGLTWAVTSHLNAQNEFRQLRGAIWVVQTELRENGNRIRAHDPDPDPDLQPQEAALRAVHPQDQVPQPKDLLLLGDWMDVKVAFANLATRDEALFDEVAKTYGRISDFTAGRSSERPTAKELETLANKLRARGRDLKSPWHPRRLTDRIRGWFPKRRASEPPAPN